MIVLSLMIENTLKQSIVDKKIDDKEAHDLKKDIVIIWIRELI